MAPSPSYVQGLIQERGLCTDVTLPLRSHSAVNDLLLCARVLQLTRTELYFLHPSDPGPFSPRNEIQALSSVSTAIARATPGRATAVDPACLTTAPAGDQEGPGNHNAPQSDSGPSGRRSEAAGGHPTALLQLQRDLVRAVHGQLDDFCRQEEPVIGLMCKGDAEAELCAWAAENGCVINICPAGTTHPPAIIALQHSPPLTPSFWSLSCTRVSQHWEGGSRFKRPSSW